MVDRLVPSGVGAGSGVEEGAGGVDERLRARWLEAEVAREAEVSEGVPLVWSTGGGRVFGILGEELFDGALVGEDGCGVDVCGGDVGVAGEDELRVFEGAGGVRVVAGDAGCFDEGGDGVWEVGEGADEALGFEVSGEFWPALEAVFAGEDELGVGEGEVGGGDFGEGEFVEGGVMALDTVERIRLRCAVGLQKILGLFFVLFEVRASG